MVEYSIDYRWNWLICAMSFLLGLKTYNVEILCYSLHTSVQERNALLICHPVSNKPYSYPPTTRMSISTNIQSQYINTCFFKNLILIKVFQSSTSIIQLELIDFWRSIIHRMYQLMVLPLIDTFCSIVSIWHEFAKQFTEIFENNNSSTFSCSKIFSHLF